MKFDFGLFLRLFLLILVARLAVVQVLDKAGFVGLVVILYIWAGWEAAKKEHDLVNIAKMAIILGCSEGIASTFTEPGVLSNPFLFLLAVVFEALLAVAFMAIGAWLSNRFRTEKPDNDSKKAKRKASNSDNLSGS